MKTINKSDWFYQQGYQQMQVKLAGAQAEATRVHQEFIERLMDTPRSERLECVALYNAGRDDFEKGAI